MGKYYCNICRKDITKAEFLYSIDKFDRALCREHQKEERETQKTKTEPSRELEINQVPMSIPDEKEIPLETKSGWKTVLKKAAIATGKGIIKGTKKLVDASKKSMQIRRWKDDILRRMTMKQLKQLCFERRIKTTRSELHSTSRGTYWKTINLTKGELVSRIKNRVSLDEVTSYAKRNRINIRDILRDIEKKKSEWKIKELTEEMEEYGKTLMLEIEKSIREFKPLRRYRQEILYQDSLASWLKSKYTDTEIEVSKGSTRPDIVIGGVAIEIKGPTYDKDLTTIPDKCIRYSQYFPNGMICVLFNVQVSPQRYYDWIRGMNEKYPEVIIIRKN